MEINYLLNRLMMDEHAKFILELDEKDIPSPIIIQRFLMQNINSPKKLQILNRFVYTVPKQMFLTLVWSLMFSNGKKYNKKHFFKYLKGKNKDGKYQTIYDKLKEQYRLSETDFKICKSFVDKSIENNKVEWFSYYGVKKSEWYNNNIDFDRIKEYKERPKEKNGLNKWF